MTNEPERENNDMIQATQSSHANNDEIREWLVRDLVETYPMSLSLLSPWGVDTCCGGARTVGDALALHHAPVDDVLAQLAELVGSAQPAS